MTQKEAIERAGEIIQSKTGNRGFCALAQIDLDGYPTAATISVSKAQGIEWVAFCSGIDSNWARRARHCDRASLCFGADAPVYNLTLVGTLSVRDDIETRRAMWYDGMGTYFSGPEDPGFCVLRFETLRYSLMLEESEGVVRGTL